MNLLYRISFLGKPLLILIFLIAVIQQAYSQKKGKPQPNETIPLCFSSRGVLEGPLPTVIPPKKVILFSIKDETLNSPTTLQRKLKQMVCLDNTIPECMKTEFRGVSIPGGNFSNEIDELKKTTYQLTGSEKQDLNKDVHLLGQYPKGNPNPWTVTLKKNNADALFFKKYFFDQKDGSNGYQSWDKYKPVVQDFYGSYSKYASEVKRIDIAIKTLKKEKTGCCGEDQALLDTYKEKRCQYLDSLQSSQAILCRIANEIIIENKGWMIKWLWYTGGKPLLNPFGMTSPAEESARIEQELASAEAVLKLHSSVSGEYCCNSEDMTKMLAVLSPAIANLNHEVSRLKQLQASAPARQKKYEEWLKALAGTSSTLNRVTLYSSEPDRIHWMTHRDAQNKYSTMHPPRQLPDYVYEDDALTGLVHNLPHGKEVSAKETVKATPLRTEIDIQTDAFSEAFSAGLLGANNISALANSIKGILVTLSLMKSESPEKDGKRSGSSRFPQTESSEKRMPIIISELREVLDENLKGRAITTYTDSLDMINNLLKDFDNNYMKYRSRIDNALNRKKETKKLSRTEFYEAALILQEAYKGGIEFDMQISTTVSNLRLTENKRDCDKEYDDFVKSDQLIEWLMAQTDPPLADMAAAYSAFDRSDPPPMLRTENVLAQEAEGSNTISYEIFEAGKEKTVASGSYKTYHTVRFWPSVSINYVLDSREVNLFDPATGQFRTDTGIDNFEAVAGVKLYFGKTNLTRTHSRSKFIRNHLGQAYNRSRGNDLSGKMFATLGLGVSHKFLKNYVVGMGFDIVPGLSVQAGGNVFFKKAYKINNGQVQREYDAPDLRFFFGLAIDPNVVTKLISIF